MLRKYLSIDLVLLALALLSLLKIAAAETASWDRFRGPNGSGVSLDPSPTPTIWSPEKNIRWKTELPGPGSSSPIVVGNRVFVTCWTGYGTAGSPDASIDLLRRNLLCIDRSTGKMLWNQSVEAVLPEDSYDGMFSEHGYASHTPTSDGERVYAFFGKSGVIAFDLEGNELWRQSVGDGLDPKRWGSSSSPILYQDLVIVNASAEKHAIVAMDKYSGKIIWQKRAEGLHSTWGTPILVKVDNSRTDLVLGVPYQLWGFDPANGNLRWYCTAMETDTFCSSVLSDRSTIYAIAGRYGGSIAIKAGGKEDISKTHVLWSGKETSPISTPVLYEDRLYFFNRGIANCIEARTGKEIFRGRLQKTLADSQVGTQPSDAASDSKGNVGQQRGGKDYSSPIIAGGMIYYMSQSGDIYVIQPGVELKQIAVNRVSNDDEEEYSSSPAASNGELFIRSTKRLYCVSN